MAAVRYIESEKPEPGAPVAQTGTTPRRWVRRLVLSLEIVSVVFALGAGGYNAFLWLDDRWQLPDPNDLFDDLPTTTGVWGFVSTSPNPCAIGYRLPTGRDYFALTYVPVVAERPHKAWLGQLRTRLTAFAGVGDGRYPTSLDLYHDTKSKHIEDIGEINSGVLYIPQKTAAERLNLREQLRAYQTAVITLSLPDGTQIPSPVLDLTDSYHEIDDAVGLCRGVLASQRK